MTDHSPSSDSSHRQQAPADVAPELSFVEYRDDGDDATETR